MEDWDEAERVRRRVAHRLHDGPIQELTAAQLFLDGVALRMDAQQIDTVLRDSLERGLEALRNATVACRWLMDSLRPGLEGEGELGERLRRLVLEVAGDDADLAEVMVDVPPGFGRFCLPVALTLYRVAEDLLEQARVEDAVLRGVALVAREDRAELTVTVDQGAPFSRMGENLQWAERRAKSAGGSLESTEDGHTVIVVVPIVPA